MTPDPDEATRAARNAFYRDVPGIPAWTEVPEAIREDWRAVAATVQAQVWAEAYGAGRDDEAAAEPIRPNPFLSARPTHKE